VLCAEVASVLQTSKFIEKGASVPLKPFALAVIVLSLELIEGAVIFSILTTIIVNSMYWKCTVSRLNVLKEISSCSLSGRSLPDDCFSSFVSAVVTAFFQILLCFIATY